MGIGTIRRGAEESVRIKDDVVHLISLKQSLKEADKKHYIIGLSSYLPRRLFNELKEKKIVLMKGSFFKQPPHIKKLFRVKYLYTHHAVYLWEVDYGKLTSLISAKIDTLVITEF
jgi:hypothetical protein